MYEVSALLLASTPRPAGDEVAVWLRAFVGLFVVMNSLPLLPVVASMTAGRPPAERRSVLNQALLAGAAVASLLVLTGPILFEYIGILLNDLRLGGGLVLLVFAIYQLLFSIDIDKRRADSHEVGIVPLGIPILMGPASLTTLMVQAEALTAAYRPGPGALLALAILAANLAINWLLVQNANLLVTWLGSSFSRALGKIYSLLLAAIAMSMLRLGIVGILKDLPQ